MNNKDRDKAAIRAALKYVSSTGKPGTLQLIAGLEYADLPEQARQGLQLLQKSMDKPETKTASRAVALWDDQLTDEERNWLQHTEAGSKEMWRRIGLASQLCAFLQRAKTGGR